MSTTVAPNLPSPANSDESTTPNFFILSVIFSICLSIVFFAISIILFIIRQIVQRTVEQRNMNTLLAHKRKESQELTQEMKQILKEKDRKLQIGMDVLFAFENLTLMLAMLVVITILAEAVAFNLINWGYSIGFGLFIIFLTSIHTFRVRRVERKKELKEAIDVTNPHSFGQSLEKGNNTQVMLAQELSPVNMEHMEVPTTPVTDPSVTPTPSDTPISPSDHDLNPHEEVIHKEEAMYVPIFFHFLTNILGHFVIL
jgi:hypothetical protein